LYTKYVGVRMYEYSAEYISNYDGDTIDFLVDCGFGVYKKITVRVRGVDTPEIKTKDSMEKKRAKVSKIYTQTELQKAQKIIIRTYKTKTGKDKKSFTRYIADVIYYLNIDDHLLSFNLCEELIKTDNGKKYKKKS